MYIYMPENEIVASFKRAYHKIQQIIVLSELNACSCDDIVNVLLRNGIERSELPKKYRKRDYDLTCKIYQR